MGPTDDVPLKYTVTIRGIYTTVEKAKVTLIDGHWPHPCCRRKHWDEETRELKTIGFKKLSSVRISSSAGSLLWYKRYQHVPNGHV